MTKNTTHPPAGTTKVQRDPNLTLIADGVMTLNRKRVHVTVHAQSIDGILPDLLRLNAAKVPVGACLFCKSVLLDVLGVQFRTNVFGYAKDTKSLLVAAAPFFQAMANAISQRLANNW